MRVNQDNKNWYALYTHSRCEFKFEEALKVQGVSIYLPVTQEVASSSLVGPALVKPCKLSTYRVFTF